MQYRRSLLVIADQRKEKTMESSIRYRSLLFAGLFGLVMAIAPAWGDEQCQDCYENPTAQCQEVYPGVEQCWSDAQCCLFPGGLCSQMDNDPQWFSALINSTYCSEIWVNDLGLECWGTDLSCWDDDDDGGGGAGGARHFAGRGCTSLAAAED
jgi:hypothetical protein